MIESILNIMPVVGATAVYIGVMVSMILMVAAIGYVLFTFGNCIRKRLSGKTDSVTKCTLGPGCPC